MAGLGEILQNTRQMRGVSLEEAERATHISRRYLQALEAEDFSVFVAPVFARGFLRNYSQYLGLDPDEMLAYWPGDTTAPEPPPPEESDLTLSDVRGSRTDSESARAEFERRAQPLRQRRPASRRPRSVPAGDAPSPLSRPMLSSAGSTAATPPARVLSIAAVLVGLLVVLAFIAGRSGGNTSLAARGNTPAVATSVGVPTGNQAKPTQPAPARRAGSMPDLVGKDGVAAVQQLQQVGVTPLVIVVQSTNRNDRPGAVTKQEPPSGNPITTGTGVTLVVNAGGATPAPGVGSPTRAPTPRPGASSTVPVIGTAPSSPQRSPTAPR